VTRITGTFKEAYARTFEFFLEWEMFKKNIVQKIK